MTAFRSLPVLAVRRMLGNWRLLSSVVVGTIVAAAILSATAIYADAIRDLGLQYALRQHPPAALDIGVSVSNVPVSATAAQRANQRQDAEVTAALRGAAVGAVRVTTSATLYATAAGTRPDPNDDARPRANLVVRSAFADHVTVTSGSMPVAMARGARGPLPVAVGEETARRASLRVGSALDLYPFWDDQAPPIAVQVAAIVRARDPRERYWGLEARGPEASSQGHPTYLLFVPEATLFGAAVERLPSLSADHENRYLVQRDALDARNALPVADGLGALPGALTGAEGRPFITSRLEPTLRTFDRQLFFTRIPLLVLLLQIGGIVAYYLVMVSTMLVERQAAEIATLRSRGATTAQLLAQYGLEGAILALLAALVGPPVAAAVVSALGPTPAFAALSGGGPLAVHVGGGAYVLALVGALLAFGSLMIPAWRATRVTVLEFKRGAARPRPTPLLLRLYIDVAAVGIVALVLWRLVRERTLVTQPLVGEVRADLLLLAMPAVLMVTAGVVFLRLFPLVMRGVGWLVSQTRSVAAVVGVRSLVRNPTHYARLILLLMFATGVGMFGATFSATLDRSYEDRAHYAVGGDVRASGIPMPNVAGAGRLAPLIDRVPAEGRTPIVRIDGTLSAGAHLASVEVVGIDPPTFDRVAFFRGDFAAQGLRTMLDALAQDDAPPAPGARLPADARQVGAWVRFPDIRGPVVLGIALQDAAGHLTNRRLGEARPGDPATSGWAFFTADLQQPTAMSGAPFREVAATPPYEVRGLFVVPTGAIASQRGAVEFGPVLATAAVPGAPTTPNLAAGLDRAAQAWPGATLVQDLTRPGVEVIQGTRTALLPDAARPVTGGPPGTTAGALRYEWQETGVNPALRGVRPAADMRPLHVYLWRATATRLEVGPGDAVQLAVRGRNVAATVAGIIDYFPTFQPPHDDHLARGLAVVSGGRLATAVNAALPDIPVAPTEAWFASGDAAATRDALAALAPTAIVERDAVRAAQQRDPLIAAGWSGILAIAFGAVLLLSAIGFIVYSYLTAQQRALEFAILRTLGFSRAQIVGVVLFEHCFVIAAGMGLGTILGLRVGRFMLAFLAIDERGGQVVPPFLQQVSWGEVLVVWAILGTVFVATIAAVVALYFRLAVSRALRIGDA